jgi:hypothetical protein
VVSKTETNSLLMKVFRKPKPRVTFKNQIPAQHYLKRYPIYFLIIPFYLDRAYSSMFRYVSLLVN